MEELFCLHRAVLGCVQFITLPCERILSPPTKTRHSLVFVVRAWIGDHHPLAIRRATIPSRERKHIVGKVHHEINSTLRKLIKDHGYGVKRQGTLIVPTMQVRENASREEIDEYGVSYASTGRCKSSWHVIATSSFTRHVKTACSTLLYCECYCTVQEEIQSTTRAILGVFCVWFENKNIVRNFFPISERDKRSSLG